MSDVHALSGAYAVDALDELERARFEKHLAECDDCRDEVASLRETAAALADDAAVEPPATLRAAVLAAAAQVRPLPPVVPEPVAALLETPRHRRILAAVAAAIVLVVGGSVAAWHPWSDHTVPVAEQVLRAPDATRTTVKVGAATATVVRSVSVGRAVVVTENMPAAPAGRSYELWLERGGHMLPAGLMTGKSPQLLDGDAASATAAGITVEPAGGSAAPTTQPIALFDFTAGA